MTTEGYIEKQYIVLSISTDFITTKLGFRVILQILCFPEHIQHLKNIKTEIFKIIYT